ncbi:MAG: DUF1015 domain-containing protein [Acidobacteria bacterium]|nr:DUF1015 domain-containing protein [Acidobacteriota bacterium]
MAVIHPFRALRPPADLVAQVASVPYDVVNTEEARALASGNPWSFLHVSRPEIDLPQGTDIYSEEVYKKAVDNFRELTERCPLKMETEPSLYLYRLIMGEQEQIGVVACCAVDEYDNNTILKHEKTRRDKEDDRTRHIMALRAQTGPVFLTYRGNQEIDTMVMEVTVTEALYDFTAPDGVQHTIWHVPDAVRFVQAFRDVPQFYIADGHHRAASASRARAEMREIQGDKHTGEEEYNFFLAVLFPAEQLRILPYNRVVRDLNGLSAEEFLAEVGKKFNVSEGASPAPASRGNWSMYLDGRWYGLTLKDASQLETDDPVASLDVSILQENLLDPILGIKDVRTDKRIDFVGGIRGTEELEQLVNDGRAAVAFSLSPTTIDDLLNVSDAGSIMPPKSTWFEPKLRDALLIHNI